MKNIAFWGLYLQKKSSHPYDFICFVLIFGAVCRAGEYHVHMTRDVLVSSRPCLRGTKVSLGPTARLGGFPKNSKKERVDNFFGYVPALVVKRHQNNEKT